MGTINVAANLHHVRGRIAAAERGANRPPGSVQLLAVSKTKPATVIRDAWAGGQRAFGENYAQEAELKARELADLGIEWHFIGPIQSNKTRSLANAMGWVHSVDRYKIARRLSEQRDPSLPPLNICLQVKLSDEASKSGATPQQLEALAGQLTALPNLCLRRPDDDTSSVDRPGQTARGLRQAAGTFRRTEKGTSDPGYLVHGHVRGSRGRGRRGRHPGACGNRYFWPSIAGHRRSQGH